ncbi:tyrosine--tRNA ligase [Erysipelothrix urinaevulpis]|uniref:tyrosine--tRNA ligase n=1 Tax=Erysipelothrix urinaevulpis TaxID=2683717 RepID=UPI001359C4A5|nr:tyrosine--tRNA ligase [Erysipelothrix urinaevulpis]
MTLLEELQWRGLVKDVTDREGLEERLKTPVTLYCGFDPTADSLHVGHLQQLILLKRYQRVGHHPIAVIGGATGMIGDPRPTTERQLLNDEDLQKNFDGISEQIVRILTSDDNPIKIMNNADWLTGIQMLEFLRDYGKHFSVNTMLAKETVASRLDSGISYTEFSYIILQAIDFLHLYEQENIELQIGGSDQWGNLVAGADLIRKMKGNDAKVYGVTSHLIMKSDGTKFGKSEGANVWLDHNRTSPYEFYQFFYNTSDADVIDFLKRLSLRSVDEIKAIIESFEKEPHKRLAQRSLAEELTSIVFGDEGLQQALNITEALFSGQIKTLSNEEIHQAFKGMSTHELKEYGNIVDVLVASKVFPSKREARQLIEGGALYINGEQIKDLDYVIDETSLIADELTIIRRGKKTYFVLKHVD